MRDVRRLGFRRAAASDDPRLRRVSCIDRGCAAALLESFSFSIVGSCRPCPGQWLCRGVGRLVWRHRGRAMRCRAEFANKPRAPHPNELVAGTELLCIVRHFRVRVHPRSRGGRGARRDACSTASGRQVVSCRSCDRGQVYCSKACSARSRTDRPPGRPSGCVRGDCPGRRARAARERPLRARYFPDWAGIGCSCPEIQTAARSIPAPHFTPLTVLRRSSPGY